MNEKLLVDFKNVLDEVIEQHPDLGRAVGDDGYTLRNYVRRGLRHFCMLTYAFSPDEDFADQDIYEAAQWAHAEYLLEKQERTNNE